MLEGLHSGTDKGVFENNIEIILLVSHKMCCFGILSRISWRTDINYLLIIINYIHVLIVFIAGYIFVFLPKHTKCCLIM